MIDKKEIELLFFRIATRDDEEALKQLFFEFYPSLCVFAERYTGCGETGRDIVQDTFFYVWKNRKQIEVTSSFRNFLITCVRNKCTDYTRKQVLSDEYENRAPSPQNSSPEQIYTLNELQSLINQALLKLPENARQAFELNRFHGMTYAQVAQKMQISVKTVEAYMSRSLKFLREELKDYLPFLFLFVWG